MDSGITERLKALDDALDALDKASFLDKANRAPAALAAARAVLGGLVDEVSTLRGEVMELRQWRRSASEQSSAETRDAGRTYP